MEKQFTKEQLLNGIRVIDEYFKETEQVFAETAELVKDGVPEEFKDEWESVLKERNAMRNTRFLFVLDLRTNHGIEVE